MRPLPPRPTPVGSVVSMMVASGILMLAMLLATPVVVPAVTQSAAGSQPTGPGLCPNREIPPPPVDTSEHPTPGMPVPAPVAVPADPVGGARMGECGVVAPVGAPVPPATVTAASWVLADLDSGAVLAAKDPHARQRPASLLKILLSIVVLRELKMDTTVVGTQEDANQDGTKVGIGPGGQYTVHQLLYALLMRSGNDAAHALAGQLGGVPETLRKMNAVAAEFGALDTRAGSPSGLDGPGMSCSAYDLSVLFRVAMRFPDFVAAIGTKEIDFPGYGGRPGFKVGNDNRLLGRYDGFLGGKTGFTDDARHTYAGAAQRNGRRLVVILMRGEQRPVLMADQAAQLLDYGFGLVQVASRPVGQLVEAAPNATPPAGQRRASGGSTATGSAPTSQSAFGTVGLPLTALAAVVALLVGFLFLRRRRARARLAAREPIAAGSVNRDPG